MGLMSIHGVKLVRNVWIVLKYRRNDKKTKQKRSMCVYTIYRRKIDYTEFTLWERERKRKSEKRNGNKESNWIEMWKKWTFREKENVEHTHREHKRKGEQQKHIEHEKLDWNIHMPRNSEACIHTHTHIQEEQLSENIWLMDITFLHLRFGGCHWKQHRIVCLSVLHTYSVRE